MRILALSSRYPPDDVGGYELACCSVMNHLQARGHEVSVLTSGGARVTRAATTADGEQIFRWLDFVPLAHCLAEPVWRQAARDWRNQSACRQALNSVRPDVISLWDMWGLLPSLVAAVSQAGPPVTCAVSSPWMLDFAAIPDLWAAHWAHGQSTGLKRLAKRIAGPVLRSLACPGAPVANWQPGLRRAFFVSESLKAQHVAAGLASPDAPVIYHGIDCVQFAPRRRTGTEGRRLLVAGRVVPEKGVHTAVEAMGQLPAEVRSSGLTLDIIGPQPNAEYMLSLRALVARHGLEKVVHCWPRVPHREMLAVYNAHDVLILPSVWEEPSALVMLEAMACGLPVVGTMTGGTPEVLRPEVTGLGFAAGDAASLAVQLVRLWTEPGLGEALATQARFLVERDFTVDRMVDQVEQFLGGQN